MTSTDNNSIEVRDLSYSYGSEPCLHNISFSVSAGSRVLVIGLNGAGKSTLLALLGGKKMFSPSDAIQIFKRDAFNDAALLSKVMYMGSWWRNDYFMDITVEQLVEKYWNTSRLERLLTILDVKLEWRVNKISDGQRRRCQLLMNLLERRDVYLMDEVTVDLDVVGREALMQMLKKESEEYRNTIVYATHIFDNLENWPTHLLYLSNGRVALFTELNQYLPYQKNRENLECRQPLFQTIITLLRNEKMSTDACFTSVASA